MPAGWALHVLEINPHLLIWHCKATWKVVAGQTAVQTNRLSVETPDSGGLKTSAA